MEGVKPCLITKQINYNNCMIYHQNLLSCRTALLPFFFLEALSTSNNSMSLSSSELNDNTGFFLAPLAFCVRGAGVLVSPSITSSSSLLSIFRRVLPFPAAFLAIKYQKKKKKKNEILEDHYYCFSFQVKSHINQSLQITFSLQGCHSLCISIFFLDVFYFSIPFYASKS